MASASARVLASGFSHEHVLAGFEGGDGDLGVHPAGGADIDDVDVVPVEDGTPVGGGLGPAILLRGRSDLPGVPAHEHFLLEGRDIEVGRDVPPRIRMGLAHKRVADHRHTQGAVARVGAAGDSWEVIAYS